MTILVHWLAACTGVPEGPCVGFAPEAWDPQLEPDVRIDEATAAWMASEGGTIDAAATDCAVPPCLGLSGPVTAELEVPVNRGTAYTVSGILDSHSSGTVRVLRRDDTGDRILAEQVFDTGTSSVDLAFSLSSPGDEVTVAVAVEGDAVLDAFAVTGERWAATDAEPTGPLLLGFLVHVEDDVLFDLDEATWSRRARVLEGLSAILAGHGAGLTIQADASFIRGAPIWDPGWIAAREAEGADWSVHLHDESDPAGIEPAMRDGRDALRDAGAKATDLNGGFVTADWATAATSGFLSLTAFKDPDTQTGLPQTQIQPWRPADGAGAADPAAFLIHDPTGPLLYLPGHDRREGVHARFTEAAQNVLSQVQSHARENYINTWYFVLHVDAFGPDASDTEAYDLWLDDGLPADLAPYDALLTALEAEVDAGRVVWSTPTDMAEQWSAWNASCAP